VCTGTHALASISAVENAIGSQPPEQAVLIRDMILSATDIHDHVVHFYHLHALDFVNAANAASADPQKAVDFAKSIGSTWRGNNLTRMTEVRDTVKNLVESGQLSVFTGGYWGHSDYRLQPEADLMAVAHYLDALEFQRSMIRIVTTFGGKNPHPHFLVGGMACTIDQNKSETVNQVQVSQLQAWIAEINEFVATCYVPDAMAIVGVYKDYFDIGAANPNYLAVGLAGATFSGDPNEVPKFPTSKMAVKPGVIYDDDFSQVHPFDPTLIAESVNSTWLSYEGGEKALTPDKGQTKMAYSGPQPPYESKTMASDDSVLVVSRDSDWDGKYTWCKEPMYNGKRMQVGPVARVIMAYAQGHPRMKEIVDGAVAKLGITLGQMNSTAGRALARAAECLLTAEILAQDTFPKFVENLKKGNIDVFDASKWEPSSWPKESSGYGMVEVARGMLSHWVTVKDRKIERYQCVVPTTWLGGGRDESGQMSPFEHSLAGDKNHPLADPKQPLEVLRTIHSFDPCMSCAVHVLDVDGNILQVAQS
jgi:hydrogenase large subunit